MPRLKQPTATQARLPNVTNVTTIDRKKNYFTTIEIHKKVIFGENKEQTKITDLHEYMMMVQQPYEDWNN